MPCNWVKIGDTIAHIRTTGRRPKNCFYCREPHAFLCDFPVGKTKNGKKKDCDRPLCHKHTQKGVSQNIDFCREHYPLAKAAYERRMKREENK